MHMLCTVCGTSNGFETLQTAHACSWGHAPYGHHLINPFPGVLPPESTEPILVSRALLSTTGKKSNVVPAQAINLTELANYQYQ